SAAKPKPAAKPRPSRPAKKPSSKSRSSAPASKRPKLKPKPTATAKQRAESEAAKKRARRKRKKSARNSRDARLGRVGIDALPAPVRESAKRTQSHRGLSRGDRYGSSHGRTGARSGRRSRAERFLPRRAGLAKRFNLCPAPQGLEWLDRSVPGSDCALCRRGGRESDAQIRETGGAGHRRPRWRSQLSRPPGLRWRDRHRPEQDEGDQG